MSVSTPEHGEGGAMEDPTGVTRPDPATAVPEEPEQTHVPYTGMREMPANADAGPAPTTTHSTWGAGNPHLLVTDEIERFSFPLDEDEVRIGAATGCQLVLPGIDALHATITHDDRDEYVLVLHGQGEMNANPEAAASDVAGSPAGERSEVLRTGARFTAGAWRFVFMRDEFADHGRPFGGRIGGELSDQPPQPARPDYSDPEHPEWSGRWEVQDD
ncbi:FHA domain-containing protein [Microbacterium sp. ZW T5_56]|uniref:FHA domain-containing protein n=1 Tax=Microbacterium sp. ZW T5_56 TaxID=3378081 RepID=UPI0038520E57